MRAGRCLAAFWRLGWRDRLLLAEAVVLLAVARATVRWVPFRRLAPHLGSATEPAFEARANGGRPARIGAAVRAASSAVPWRTACLTEAIAAQWMLRRRHLPGVLHLGIHKDGPTMTAHAWTSCGTEDVVGGGGGAVDSFTPLAAFGTRP